MNRRLSAYLLVAALASTAPVAAVLWVFARDGAADLSLVRTELLYADWSTSRARLESLSGAWGARGRARAGMTVIDALTADAAQSVDRRVDADDLAYFPLGLLLQRALAEQRYDGCLRLVALLRRAGAPSFPEFEAAAMLELGQPEAARAVALPRRPRTRLRHALAQVLAGDLDDLLVRDRDGDLLGKARLLPTGSWFFFPELGVDRAIVPAPAIADLSTVLPARSVRLTIDRDLAEMAMRSLGAYRGSIVVVDPMDGAVLAAVSDRRTFAEGGSPPLEQMREPASIAKIITVTAALRAGYDVDAILHDMTCRGSMKFGDGVLYCAAVNGKLYGLDRALAVSCNVAFAHLGELVGRQKLLEEFRRYGFGYDGVESGWFGRVVEPEGSPRQLGDLSIGLEATAITPVHAALEAATVANGGWMHPPRLHRSTDTYLGFSERVLPASEGWQVLDPRWLPMLTRAMTAVAAPGGTAARLAPPSFPVALKTGTASEPGTGFHVNYIGFGPVDHPRLAFAVRITHQPSSRRVRNAAHAVTRRLLEGLARLDRARPSEPLTLRRGTELAELGGRAAGG